jgi:hypothetical protein
VHFDAEVFSGGELERRQHAHPAIGQIAHAQLGMLQGLAGADER